MKHFLFPVLLNLLFLTCTNNIGFKVNDHLPDEDFEDIDPSLFNSKVKSQNNIEDGEALMRLYYPQRVDANSEGKQSMSIKSEVLKNELYKVTLIHDYMLDDSQKGLKLILFAEKTDAGWQVKAIKKNWKCWKGRGHEDWGVELCR